MSKESWHKKLQDIQFYILTFRMLSLFLLISFILNLVFGGLIYYAYFQQGDHAFYATSGIVAPVGLTPRIEPNFSSTAILTTPKKTEEADKPIPE